MFLDLVPIPSLMDPDNEDRYSWEIELIVEELNNKLQWNDEIEISTRDKEIGQVLGIEDPRKLQHKIHKLFRDNKAIIEDKANVIISEIKDQTKKIKITLIQKQDELPEELERFKFN